jgi:hypothetical protein
MKSKLTPITLIITALLIVLGYFAYTNYLVPFYQNNQQFTKTVNLSSDQNLVLVADKEQKNIGGLEIEITGTSNNNVSIITYDSGKQNIQSAMLKKGEIDHINILNWSQDSCFMDITIPKNTKGKLVINYRFIGSK